MSASEKPALRADAARNRTKILAAARRLYEESGEAGPEQVARAAGVGVGTLYRHFPNREALAAAVYEDELEQVAVAASELLRTHPPVEALRLWMDRFARRFDMKRAMGDAVWSLVRGGTVTADRSRARLAEATQVLVEAGIESGELRTDIRGEDIVVALVGICVTCPDASQREQASRLMDLLLAGLIAPSRVFRL
ncbi:TetR/AcrR family transcriptional regulator [Leifsonia sp. fls2-241-R2A-40a]|uniref:TetR/AcrR family transcriptional regulator n=1 Tax=Leifsonia sp. fls2-241-R2A-40a TaxID=3040290 RepID=UPI00254A414E|nr:TetR/AcrR family transcriptional regulator [Leifsonia sp. fls2-241-R2A-40a]